MGLDRFVRVIPRVTLELVINVLHGQQLENEAWNLFWSRKDWHTMYC